MSVAPPSPDGLLALLPDNVLHNIFDRLGAWDLLCLSRMSERIQRVSLGIYYDRRGVDVSPTGIIDITREEDYDLLAILRITTFFVRAGHISVVFVFPKWNFMENIKNLTLILRRLVSVDMITFTFRFNPEARIEEERRSRILTAEAKSSRYKGLSKELQTLFYTAFRVAGMVRILESEHLLQMVGGDLQDSVFLQTCFGSGGPPIVSKYKVAAKVRINKIGAKITGRKCKEREIEAPPNSSVVTLDIRSLLPIAPPFLPWTVSCLNFQANLRHLSFTTASEDRVHWDALFSNLNIPSLIQLTISSNSCTLHNLAKFVKRHLQVSILDIRDFAPIPAELPKVANCAFRHLSSLTAPGEVLGGFLAYPADVVPNLKEAHLAITVTEDHQFDLSRPWSALAPVIQRLHKLVVGLVVAYETGESPFGETLEGEEKKSLVPLIQVLTLRLRDDLEASIFGPLTDWIEQFVNTRELKVQSVYPYQYPIQTFYTREAIQAEEDKKRKRETLCKDLRDRVIAMENVEACEIFGKRYP